jgi:hypothetical protein
LETDILKPVSVLSGLLPIVLFLVFLRRNKEAKLWVIFLYTILSLITDILFDALPQENKVSSFYLFSFFTITEFTIFSSFIFLQIKKKALRLFIAFSSIIFYAFAINNLLTRPASSIPISENSFDSVPASVESILVILYCILLYFEQMRRPEISFIYSTKVFWVATAFLLYLAATLFLFISTASLTEKEQEAYWPINLLSNILKNILLSIAFILPKHKSPSPSDNDLYNKAFAPPFN